MQIEPDTCFLAGSRKHDFCGANEATWASL